MDVTGASIVYGGCSSVNRFDLISSICKALDAGLDAPDVDTTAHHLRECLPSGARKLAQEAGHAAILFLQLASQEWCKMRVTVSAIVAEVPAGVAHTAAPCVGVPAEVEHVW